MSAPQRAGGIARQAQIRAVLGASGYRRYQQVLARAGGIARQAQLRTTLGETGYCAHQRTLYQRAVQKHGAAKMQAIRRPTSDAAAGASPTPRLPRRCSTGSRSTLGSRCTPICPAPSPGARFAPRRSAGPLPPPTR